MDHWCTVDILSEENQGEKITANCKDTNFFSRTYSCTIYCIYSFMLFVAFKTKCQ